MSELSRKYRKSKNGNHYKRYRFYGNIHRRKFVIFASGECKGVHIVSQPCEELCNFGARSIQENTLLQILDINGRRVRTLELKAGVETLRIDLGDLPKGVYTIMLGNTIKKLIVE